MLPTRNTSYELQKTHRCIPVGVSGFTTIHTESFGCNQYCRVQINARVEQYDC